MCLKPPNLLTEMVLARTLQSALEGGKEATIEKLISVQPLAVKHQGILYKLDK